MDVEPVGSGRTTPSRKSFETGLGAMALGEAVTLPEVTQLWWFCDGAIMDAGTRQHLWRSWGLCNRHSWLYFCAENELKYQPLGNAILYEDLVARSVHLLSAHRRIQHKLRRLSAHASCLTCDYVRSARTGNPTFADLSIAVEAAIRSRAWVNNARLVWQPHACPRCWQQTQLGGGAVVCRRHLLASGMHAARAMIGPSVEYLAGLQLRLSTCVKSMTVDGPDRTIESDAALVEALGWFAGWGCARHYVARDTPPRGLR